VLQTLKLLGYPLLILALISSCTENKVSVPDGVETSTIEKLEIDGELVEIDSVLKDFGLPVEAKNILTHTQIVKHYQGQELNLSDKQVEQLDKIGFSFLNSWNETYRNMFTPEQVKAIKRGNQVDFNEEQNAIIDKLVQDRVDEASGQFVKPDSIAPDFELVDNFGNKRKLTDFRGKYVLIDFWGTWCKPCIAELPHLKKAYAAIDKNKVEFVGVCSECPDFEAFLAEEKFDWVQLNDPAGEVSESYGVSEYPSMILIDPEGRVLETPYNGDALMSDKLETINKYLK
jgi:peroxiredoxin